jgi:hypothetical protein
MFNELQYTGFLIVIAMYILAFIQNKIYETKNKPLSKNKEQRYFKYIDCSDPSRFVSYKIETKEVKNESTGN